MIVKAYYEGGRIDVFDTDHLVDGVPQPGNLLTNYTLDLADVGGESLWLRSYYYEAAAAYKGEPSPTRLPVARRRNGWSFLIADKEDVPKLNRLTVDGETVLVQMNDELIDAAALSWAYDVAIEYSQMVETAYGSLASLAFGEGESVDALSRIGVPPCVLERVAGTIVPQDDEAARNGCTPVRRARQRSAPVFSE